MPEKIDVDPQFLSEDFKILIRILINFLMNIMNPVLS